MSEKRRRENLMLEDWCNKYFLRVVYSISLLLGIFWLAGLAMDLVNKNDVAEIITAISFLVIFVLFMVPLYRNPCFLVPAAGESGGRIILHLLLYSIISYAIIVVIFWLAGYLLFLRGRDNSHNEAAIFVGLTAIWLPLWFAPSVGAFWTWRTLGRKNQ